MKDLENLIEQTKKTFEKAIQNEIASDKVNVVKLTGQERKIKELQNMTMILCSVICNFAFKKNEGVIMQLQNGNPNEPWSILYNYDGYSTVHMELYDKNKHAHIKLLNKFPEII